MKVITSAFDLGVPFCISLLFSSVARGEEWSAFRGPKGLGYSQQKDLPITWGGADAESVLWKSPLVGEGHASPIVWGDRVLVCTARWDESVKDRAKVIPEHHVVCYRTNDGKQLWDTTVKPGPWLRTDFRSGPGGGYAAPTPTTDGSVKWESPLPQTGFAHSTPVLIEVKGKPQLVVVASGGGEADEGVQSFDPVDGKRLWWCRGGGDASSAAFGAGIIYCDNGRGGPGVAIDPTGSGDVTKSHIKWRVNQIPEGIGSPIIVGDLVYRLHRPNVLKVWRAADGKEVYVERLDRLTSTWASPVADANGRLYFATAGVSYVIQAGKEFKALAINDLGDPNHASPAVSGGRMFLVGTRNVYCIAASQ